MLRLLNIDMKEFKKTVWPWYLNLFPDSERKPYKMLESSYNRGILQAIKIVKGDTFIGFIIANSIKNNGCLQVDYFAILPEYQNRGYGTKALERLKENSKQYYGLFIEVEKEGLGEDEEENKLRKRRIQFYERQGFYKLNVDFNLYKVIYTPLILPTSDKKESDDKIIKDIFEIYVAIQGKERIEKNCSIVKGNKI